jgi:hypothetical protein
MLRSVLVVLACAVCVVAGSCMIGVVRLESSAAAPRIAPARERIALVDLQGNVAARDGGAVSGAERWARAAQASGLGLELVTPASLAELVSEGFAAWVLPRQERLSEVDWAALDAFMATGGGVLLTGRPGVFDERGDARGRLALRRFFPGHLFEDVARLPARLRAVARGPVLTDLVPGQTLDLLPLRSALVTSTGGGLVSESRSGAGVLLVGRYRSAPVVWLAFGVDELAGESNAVLRQALQHVAGRPVLELRAWPGGHRTAALIVVEVGLDAEAAERAVRGLASRGIRPVMVITPEQAEAQPQLVRRLASLGDLALSFDGDVDTPAEGRARLERISHAPVSGLGGLLREARIAHLQASGYRWAVLGELASFAPAILGGEAGDALVTLPVSGAPVRTHDVAAVVEGLLAGYERIEALGGLYQVVFDPSWAGSSERAVLEPLVAELRTRGAWLARGEDVARWWRARQAVGASLSRVGPREVVIGLRNAGDEVVRELTARVYLPAQDGRPRLKRGRWLSPAPRSRLASDRSWIDLIVPSLDPGESVEYSLRF